MDPIARLVVALALLVVLALVVAAAGIDRR